jgi:anti-anti-sigma regulatory factor
MTPDGFKHLRLRTVGDVALVEIMTKEIQGPDLAKEFINELTEAAGWESDKPLLVDLRRVRYLSSMGYSALFKMVKCAKQQQPPRLIRFCNMHEDVRVGAEAVNLPLVVEICENETVALEAFAQA